MDGGEKGCVCDLLVRIEVAIQEAQGNVVVVGV